jgi:hypothetical protein
MAPDEVLITKARKIENTKKIKDNISCTRGAHAAQAPALRERLCCASFFSPAQLNHQ